MAASAILCRSKQIEFQDTTPVDIASERSYWATEILILNLPSHDSPIELSEISSW